MSSGRPSGTWARRFAGTAIRSRAAPKPDRAHHPVADRKALDAGAERGDAAGKLAGRREGRGGLELVFALDDERVEEVERRIGDVDHDFALAGRPAARRPSPSGFRPDQATDRSGLSFADSQFYSFFINHRQVYRGGAPCESRRPEFCPDPPARGAAGLQGQSRRMGSQGRMSMSLTGLSFLSRAGVASALVALAVAGVFAPVEAAPKKTDKKDARQARARRQLRRLERLRRPDRQGAHLLHAGAAEIARALEPQARSRLRLHLRPAGGGRAQRSVVHHGLRHLRRRGG